MLVFLKVTLEHAQTDEGVTVNVNLGACAFILNMNAKIVIGVVRK